MSTVIIIIAAVLVILIVLGVLANIDEERQKAKKKAEQDSLLTRYGIIIKILTATDYGEEAITLQPGSIEQFIVRPNGSICRINPYDNFDYSYEQLEAIMGWLEVEKADLWKQSYYNFEDLKQRVKWCIKQIEAEEREE